MVRVFALLALIATASTLSPSFADTTVYRCTQAGPPVFTDRPCDGTHAAQVATVVAPSAPTLAHATSLLAGGWQGQSQSQGREQKEMLADARSVAPLNLEFSADGKVTGASPENGCKFLGICSQGDAARMVWVDETLSDCRFAGVNRRYSHGFTLAKPESSIRLSLQSSEAIRREGYPALVAVIDGAQEE